jgi:hypothetical protein
MNEPPPAITEMVLWAWIGEDELGSGEVGLKQCTTPAGFIPLVACKDGKMDQLYIRDAMQAQASVFRKTIRLARFTFESVVITLEP